MRLRQGDIITGVCPAAQTAHNTKTKYLIITHCCSLARAEEPIELLPCHPVPRCDGNMTHGKNPRKLHFQINEQWFEIIAHQKTKYTSENLTKTSTFYTAKNKERRILQNWLALGYRRQALDSTTETMLKGLKLRRIVKKCGNDLVGIWVDCLQLEEEVDETPYYDIYFIFSNEVDFTEHSETIKNQIAKAPAARWTIKPFFQNDDNFSYYQSQTFTYINLEYLSTENVSD